MWCMALPPRRKQRLNLQPNRDGAQQGVALHFGADGVPEALEGGVEGLAAEAEEAADAAADAGPIRSYLEGALVPSSPAASASS